MGTMECVEETLGNRIRVLRNKKGYSQENLADMLHVSRQAVSSWEVDRKKPELANLVKLSKIFGVSVEELAGAGKKEEESASTEVLQEGVGVNGDEGIKSTERVVVAQESVEKNVEVWENDEKLRKILLSCAIVVAVMVVLWIHIPPEGVIVCIGGIIVSRKWKVNSIWLDCIIIIGLLVDLHNSYILLSSWIDYLQYIY